MVKYFCRHCNYTTHWLDHLDTHLKRKHDIDGLYQCDECKEPFRYQAHLIEHLRDIHGIRVHQCPKRNWSVRRFVPTKPVFKRVIEDYYCDQPGCTFKTKYKANLKAHRANIHDIDVVWHSCSYCSYVSKTRCNLARHTKRWH